MIFYCQKKKKSWKKSGWGGGGGACPPDPSIVGPDIQATRANHTGLLNLPLVETTSFGKNSIRYNAFLSWNFVQSLLPIKLCDYEEIKSDLQKCLIIASY